MTYVSTPLSRFALLRAAKWLKLGVLFSMVFASPGATQTLLGRVTAGERLELSLEQFIAPTDLLVEIDGVELPGPHTLWGTNLLVVVPDGLFGTRHDIRVYRRRTAGDEEIGAWLFETESARRLTFGSIQTDLGLRSTGNAVRDISTGVVRLEFDLSDGQATGRLVLSRDDDAGSAGRDDVSIDEIFLEIRRPVLGQDMYVRLGNTDILSQTDILDSQSRRGVTLRFENPQQTYDLALFLLQTTTEPDLDTPLGLTDPDDQLIGLNGIFQPLAFPSLRVDVTTFNGRAPTLPSGGTGDVSGSGTAILASFADGRGDISLRFAETRWSDRESAGGPTRGQAATASLNWQFAKRGGVQSLALGTKVFASDMGFFSPLNPDLIRGETGVQVSLESVDPAWQWRLEAETAKTNTGGSASDPTDRTNRVFASLLFDPGDFTGGFLNGTRFFGNLGIETLDRLITPAGAIGTQDNTLTQVSIGMEKVQPTYNWAWSITHDNVEDRADRGADQSATFASARVGLDPTEAVSAQFFARLGERRTKTTHYNEAEASFLLSRRFDHGLWQAALEGGYLFSENPDEEGGRFVTASLSRQLSEQNRLVTEATWGRDRFAPDGVSGEGWEVGLFLRSDFGFQAN